ncbi:unnamed protein product [Heterobilharzia americana]|nr:unnamed protein product [Heterobilharzia americana]
MYLRSDDGHDQLLEYVHRSTDVRLLSKNQLTYIRKKGIHEKDLIIDEYSLSDEITIDGFILVCDVNTYLSSECTDAGYLQHGNCLQEFLTYLSRIRRPSVTVLSKLDSCDTSKHVGLEFLRKSNEFKKIPVIETSAHKNINIEEAFLSLYKLMECKNRINNFKCMSYVEAISKRNQEVRSATQSFIRLMFVSVPEFLTDWESFMARYSHHTDVVNYIGLVGSSGARHKFETVVQERLKTTKLHSLNKIPGLLMHLLPDLDAVNGLSFEQIVSHIRHHEDFSLYFQDDVYYDSGNSISLNYYHPLRDDTRVPFHLAIEPTFGSENCPLKEHVDRLTTTRRHHTEKALLETSLHRGFRKCPVNTYDENSLVKNMGIILPGQPLSDVKSNIGSLDLPELTKEEISMIYQQFQLGLHILAREDFLDLLVEKTGLFVKAVINYTNHLRDNSSYISNMSNIMNEHCNELYSEVTSDLLPSKTFQSLIGVHISPRQNISSNQNKHCSAPPRGVKETQITWLDGQLSLDSRYQAMTYLPSERQTLITTYFDMLIPSIDSHRFFSKSTINDFSTTDIRGVPIPRNSVISSGMDSLTTDNFSYVDPTVEYFPENPTQQHFQSELSSPCSSCPSVSWGGCMDLFFKRLAYEYLSVDPTCKIVGNCISMDEMISSLKSNLSQKCSISYLPSLIDDQPPLILSIAVVCICTDTVAAHSIINLLSCIGFCILPFKSKNCEHSFNRCFDHNHYQSTDLLVLNATWPLPTARLLFSDSSSPFISTNLRNLPISESSKNKNLNKIYDGQVRIDLMSHHSLLNKLLSYREVTSRCEQLNDVSLTGSNNEPTSVHSNLLYSGLILITSIPSSADEEQYNSLAEKNGVVIRSHNSLDNVSDKFKNEENFVNMSEDNLHVCTLTPHLPPICQTSCETESDSKMHVECIPPSNFSCSSNQLSCTCCKLFYNKTADNPECACGQCCNCVHSLKNSSYNSFHTKSNPWGDKRSFSNLICPHRRRSWEARVAAISSIVEQLPSSIPRLVLLTESCDSKSDKKQNLDSPPHIYLAPESLSFSTFSEQLHPGISRNSDKNSSVPLNHESSSVDWMPAGTNILDHVINFLSHCWSKVGQNMSSKNVEKQKDYGQYTPKQNSVTVNRCNSPNLIVTPNLAPQSSPETSSEKPFSGGFLNTLSIASVTKRKGILSANQALRKLSGSTKRNQSCKLSPVNTNSKGFLPTLFDFHSKTSSDERTETTSEQVSYIANFQTDIPESISLQNNTCISPPLPPSVVMLNLPSRYDNIPSEDNRVSLEKSNSYEHPVRWAIGSCIYCEESPIQEEIGKAQNKNSYSKKIHSKSMYSKIMPTTNSSISLTGSCNQAFSRFTVQDCKRFTSDNRKSVQLNFDAISSSSSTSLSKILFAQSPNKLSYNGNYHDNLMYNYKNSCNIELVEKCHCSQVIPGTMKNSKQDIHLSHEASSCDFNTLAMPNDSDTPSCLSVYGETTKELFQQYNELESSFISTTVPNGNQFGTASKSSSCFDYYPLISSLSQNNSDSHIVAIQNEDDIESIYEDIISIEPISSKVKNCNSIPNPYHHLNTPLLSSHISVNHIEENIYMEPVDCLGFGCVERYHTISQKFMGSYPYVNTSSVTTVLSKELCHASISSKHSTSFVPPSNALNSWAGNDVGCRRERYRSFSTPEGCSTTSDDTEIHYTREFPTRFSSNNNFLKNIMHPFSANQINFRSVRSSHANGSCNGLHLDSNCNTTALSSTTSPLKTRMHSTDAVFETLTHYSTPVSSPASITLSDDISENALLSDEFSKFSTIRPLSLPNPLSRSHHHHFWHHPKCPHYQIHRDSLDSGLGTASTSSSKFGFQSQSTTDNINYDLCKNNTNNSNTLSCDCTLPTNPSQRINQWYPCKLSSSCVSSSSCCTSSCNSTPSNPIFIDPSDFQTHHPTQCLSFPSYNFPLVTNHNYRVTCDQPSPSSHSQSSVSMKDFKWLRRSKPLRLFGNSRLSMETQTRTYSPPSMTPSAPPPIPPPPPPPSLPIYSSFSINTPKKYTSTVVNNCNSTLHPSGSNHLLTSSSSLHLESQQLPVTRCQPLLKSLSGCSSLVNNASKLFGFNNTSTTITTTSISSSPYK